MAWEWIVAVEEDKVQDCPEANVVRPPKKKNNVKVD